MATTIHSERVPTVGERVELAQYIAAGRSRILNGQRIHGIVRVTDRPAAGTGRCYLVERDLHRKDELDALIADYLRQAHALNDVPMSTSLLDPVITSVVAIEELPAGSAATRRLIAAWSDGSQSEALAWFSYEWLSSARATSSVSPEPRSRLLLTAATVNGCATIRPPTPTSSRSSTPTSLDGVLIRRFVALFAR